MNLVHLHLLLNHFPTIGMVIGLAVFILAIATKSDEVKRASLGIFFFVALLSIPAFATGTAAQLALTDKPGISTPAIEAHESAAFLALIFMELTGALAWVGLWQFRRLARFPTGTITAVLIVGLASFGLMSRAAILGGEIRHPEIRTASSSADITPASPPLARVIGTAMAELKWCWPASEAIHFIGLCLLFGVVLVVDLRMLGFVEGIPFSTLHRLLPWAMLGFAANTATGMLFLIGAPPSFYVTNSMFFWKLGLILIAGANALYFTAFDQPWALTGTGTVPPAARFAAASGIFLWAGVLFCGHMLPFLGRSF